MKTNLSLTPHLLFAVTPLCWASAALHEEPSSYGYHTVAAVEQTPQPPTTPPSPAPPSPNSTIIPPPPAPAPPSSPVPPPPVSEASRTPPYGGKPMPPVYSGPEQHRNRGEHETPPEHREPQAFLGIASGPISPELTAQLGLPAGFGLIVQEVSPGSPAEAAGVQKFDVLKTMDDQQLVNPEQLATLVRAAGKDKEVSLTVLRKGQEQHLKAKLGERVPPPAHEGNYGNPGAPWIGGPINGANSIWSFPPGYPPAGRDRAPEEEIRRLQEQMARGADEAQKQARRAQEEAEHARDALRDRPREGYPGGGPHREGPGPDGPDGRGGPGRHPGPGGAGGPGAGRPGDAPPPPPPDHGAGAAAGSSGTSGAQITTTLTANSSSSDGSNARVTLKDNDGEIDVTAVDGKRTLVAKNAAGEQVFAGPIDTEEQRKAVPEQFRKKLGSVQIDASKSAPAPAATR